MPGSKGINNSKKLLVINVVILLSRLHSVGVESDRMEGAIWLGLGEDAGDGIVGGISFEYSR